MSMRVLLTVVCFLLAGNFLLADHQATNIIATIYPTNYTVGQTSDLKYSFNIDDVTNGRVDTFIIYNPYTNYHINNVSSITVEGTAQWLMQSSTRPGSSDQFSWYYLDGKLYLLSSQSAITSGQTVIVHFQQTLPLASGNNFDYNSKYSNSGPAGADGSTNNCQESLNSWKVDLLPEGLHHFEMIGFPTICTAGKKWINITSVTITAYDIYDNVKIDFTNDIYFTTTSPSHYLKYSNNITSYTYTLSDAGKHSFPSNDFMFNTAGNHYLFVTNEFFQIGKSSSLIQVIAADPDNFLANISVSTASAGSAFRISVYSATDTYGNDV
ncbi:MAG: hypothetical protein JW827_08270, partial [Spirochaetes bacterium]|nr:hypothetical protein [Spirochaetota bacterium]